MISAYSVDQQMILMELTEIIATYQRMSASEPDSARQFILGQFQGEHARLLQRRYLCLFMCEEDGDGYDPFTRQLYQVDPNTDTLKFCPNDGDFVLFNRKERRSGAETAALATLEKQSWIQLLQVVGTEEVLEAHQYIPDSYVAGTLRVSYRGTIERADRLTAQARTTP